MIRKLLLSLLITVSGINAGSFSCNVSSCNTNCSPCPTNSVELSSKIYSTRLGIKPGDYRPDTTNTTNEVCVNINKIENNILILQLIQNSKNSINTIIIKTN